MIPAGLHPLLMAGGDPLDELGRIERSVRLRASATPRLSRVHGAAASSNTLTTLSVWFKRGTLGSIQTLFCSYESGVSNVAGRVNLKADDTLEIYLDMASGSTDETTWTTAAVFRDPAAHYHAVIRIDTSQAANANKVLLEVNGKAVALTPAQTGTIVTTQRLAKNGVTSYWGVYNSGSFSQYFDGLIAQPIIIDGALAPAATFGLFHPATKQWRPKNKAALRAAVAALGGSRNGFGANGSFLALDDPASLTTLCYDRSQSDTDTSGNNWTATNISLTPGATYDSMLDTPTNNFCTINPLTANVYNAMPSVISNGALSVTRAGGGRGGFLSGAFPAGRKIYFEAKSTNAAVHKTIGIIATNAPYNGEFYNAEWLTTKAGANSVAWVLPSNAIYNGNTIILSGLGATATTDVLRFAIDTATGKVWVGRNATWFNSGDPAAGTGHVFTLPTGKTFYASGDVEDGSVFEFNFGQRGFEQSLPEGFEPSCTKKLPFPAIPKSESAFVASTDSGANIVATLSAAAPFSDWIRIYKRRDASEGWRWQFSDDSANYLDSSSTAAKAAFPSLSGTSYVGYALKVSAANGVATGTFVHANGTPSAVSDNLGNSRKAIILKRESAAGDNWFFYHPELTAGKLLYLNSASVETTDASIGSVTANGFTAAAALPSGTYRWVAMAEVDGFLKLWKHTGNGSPDGAFSSAGLLPNLLVMKPSTASGVGMDWLAIDSARYAYNVTTDVAPSYDVKLNLPAPENTDPWVTINSNGIKCISAASNSNASGVTYTGVAIAAAPFRYANAR